MVEHSRHNTGIHKVFQEFCVGTEQGDWLIAIRVTHMVHWFRDCHYPHLPLHVGNFELGANKKNKAT